MSLHVTVKWSGKAYKLDFLESAKIEELKAKLEAETNVKRTRQKLIGVKGSDSDPLSGAYKSGKPIMMIGSAEKDIQQVQAGRPSDAPEIIDDLDDVAEEVSLQYRTEHLRKIEHRVEKLEVEIMNPPRPGSKLLVLDIDYTLFDHRSTATNAAQLMRPYLHEFLTEAYHHNYDIVIWSATSMKWIKVKMNELGVTGNLQYKICFMIDSKAMISVLAEHYGVIEVKPLGVIWGKFPQWSRTNTIMFDDLRRNFLMNPQSGLRIRAFKNALVTQATDRELKKLTKYLRAIHTMDDFSSLDHTQWEKFLKSRKRSRDEDEAE